MKVRRLLFLLLLLKPICSYATICLPDGFTLERARALIYEKGAAHQLELAFDLHDTLLQKDEEAIKREALAYPCKWAIAANIFNFQVMAEVGHFAWDHVIRRIPLFVHIKLRKKLTGEFFLDFFEDTKAHDLEKIVVRLTNCQRIMPGMLEIIKQLKERGYILRIASNIKRKHFLLLKEKLAPQDHDIFSYFERDERGWEGKMTEKIGKKSSPLKPDPRYFQEYISQYNPAKTKLIMLIDDQSDNIAEAVCHGMIGIYFRTTAQLLQDLKALGLLS